MSAIPFLSAYDPPGASEGTLDPLGLYQIADQLAIRLVPSVRERMQRARFLTVMTLGALVTEGLDADPEEPEAEPYLIWEWLVVEALIRTPNDEKLLWGVPGTLVTRRALAGHNYVDRRSYLKTPRIFGFNGVYKRLAIHLGLVDVHLGLAAESEQLIDAWARDADYGSLSGCKPLLSKWRQAVKRSQANPARTRPGWTAAEWAQLAEATVPHGAKRREKGYLRKSLRATDTRALGALATIWDLQNEFNDDDFTEELLHQRLTEKLPAYSALLHAIQAFERFCRGLQDGFDLLCSEAASSDTQGYRITSIDAHGDFIASVSGSEHRYLEARQRLGDIDLRLLNLFDDRFANFQEPMRPSGCAVALCEHHEKVQKGKSADGKRPWFDRLGPDRIYIRHRYREPRRPISPDRFVHDYRSRPIRNFCTDLA
jgi:hypothetical protein